MELVAVLLFLVASSVVCSPLPDEYEEHDRAMQNPDLFEGDILGIDPDDDRNAITSKARLWIKGIVPYTIDPSLKGKENLIKNAMRHIESKSCITFRPAKDTDQKSIRFFKGQGCYSLVGMYKRDQPLSLGNGCHLHSIAVHEILHALGFYHEHSRSDRDEYINIHWTNINPKFKSQFTRLLPQQNILFDKFDYASVMLYGETAFSISRGLKTMTSKTPGTPIPNPYTKPGMSKSDEYRLKKLYKCK